VVLEDVLAVHGKAFLISDRRLHREILLLLAPSDGEWVVGPESDRRDVQVGVLAWAEGPRASHANRNAHSIAREDFDLTTGTAVSNVVDEETPEAHASLSNPKGKDTVQHELLWAFLEMHPDSAKSDGSTDDVTVQEHLIERVTDWGWRLEQEKCECNGALERVRLRLHEAFDNTYDETRHDELAASDRRLNSTPTL
jgi:hypothetical protein